VESWEVPAAESQAIEQSTQFKRFEKARAAFLALEKAPRPDLFGAEPAKKEAARRRLETARDKAMQAHRAWQATLRMTEIRNRPTGELNDALLRWVELRGAPERGGEMKALRELRDTCDILLDHLRSPFTETIFGNRFGHHFLWGGIDAGLGYDTHGGLTHLFEDARSLVLYDERLRMHLATIRTAAAYWGDHLSKGPSRGRPKLFDRHDFVLSVVDVFHAVGGRRSGVTKFPDSDSSRAGMRGGALPLFLAAVCRRAVERMRLLDVPVSARQVAKVEKASSERGASSWVEAALKHRAAKPATTQTKERNA
jgi:hypothetical protein